MRLRVSSIDHSINKIKLQEMFEEYGDIASIKLFRSLDGSTPSVGFVEMKRERDAQAAMSDLNGMLIGAMPLKVEVSSDIVRTTAPHSPAAAAVSDEDDDDEDDDDDLALDSTELEVDHEDEEDEEEPKEIPLDEISDEEY